MVSAKTETTVPDHSRDLFARHEAHPYNEEEQRFSQFIEQRLEKLLRGDINRLLVLRRHHGEPNRLTVPMPLQGIDEKSLRLEVVHEIGHLQVVIPGHSNPNREFASETRAQEFADDWRRRLWASRFEHPDPAHNPPSPEELAELEAE